jgi:cold shock CspA family protein
MIGRIKSWLPDKGFGFIWTEAGEFFFHESQVIGEVQPRDVVSFWLDDDLRRDSLRAVEVQRVKSQ